MPVKPGIRETVVEEALVKRVEALGGSAEKVRVIGRRGFFDRLVVLPGGRVVFVECKRPRGGVLSEHQVQRHKTYRALGATVALIWTLGDIEQMFPASGG